MALLATMIAERESNFTLFHDRSGSRHNNEAHSYRYSLSSSLSSSSSPPWSPYCSPETISQAAIPFSWEDRPGVSKHRKSPTPRVCLREHLLRPPSEFSVLETIQVERPPPRRSKKRFDDDPFMSAIVECTKQQATAISMSKDGRQGRRKQGYGSLYSCGKSSDVAAGAQVAIPSHAATQSSRKNSKNKNNEWKKQKSYPSYKFGEDNACVALLSKESQRQNSTYYADSSSISAHKNVRLSSGYKLLLSTVDFLFAKQGSDVRYRA